ncbi:MAG: EamA family transporter [Candidatus Omnitrophica bacterium]|nr:EamA family transporter [Candidatus Omnitrophota bacterium]MBD3269055.1 EamA family transporter [Candidatus Omnitrophota bacterium]
MKINAFFWAFLTALIWGVVPLIEKIGLIKAKPLAGLFYRSLGVFLAIPLMLIFLIRPSQLRSLDVRSALLLISGGFLASFVAQFCFYNSLKTGEVSRVVPVAGMYPLVSFILGIMILGESVTLIKLFGVVLVVTGVWLLKAG